MRVIKKPNIVSEGNGYIFFNIGKYIMGKQKYYNCADSDLIYYIVDKESNDIFILDMNSPIKQALRASHSLLAFSNIKSGGINLHASALTYKGNGVLLLGQKEAGKTTNMLFGLKSSEHTKFLSNDVVHLYLDNNKVYALGSGKKVTIRPNTISLFDELEFELPCGFNEHDSVGLNKSSKVIKVRTIDDVGRIFNREIQKIAPVTLFICIQYCKDSKDADIRILSDKEVTSLLSQNLHSYYNGQERFWNDIFDSCSNDNISKFLNVHAYKVTVNSYNTYQKWGEIFKELDKLENEVFDI